MKKVVAFYLPIGITLFSIILTGRTIWYAQTLPSQPAQVKKTEPLLVSTEYLPRGLKAGIDRCRVHSEALNEDIVKIEFGLLKNESNYVRALQEEFPNANRVAHGGCIIPEDTVSEEIRPKYAKVLYCQKCRVAEQKWEQAHLKR